MFDHPFLNNEPSGRYYIFKIPSEKLDFSCGALREGEIRLFHPERSIEEFFIKEEIDEIQVEKRKQKQKEVLKKEIKFLEKQLKNLK